MQVTGEYNIRIKGTRALLKQSEEILAERVKALESHWGYAAYYEDLPEKYGTAVGDAMPQERSEDYVLSMSFDEDYAGPFALILNEINARIPELAIAVLAEYGYDEGKGNAMHYSPIGSNELNADDQWTSDPLPEEEWIPLGWRHPGGAPYSHAKIEITPLGNWGREESSTLQHALQEDALLTALGFQLKWGSSVVFNGGGYYLDITGTSDLGEDMEYLEWILSGYISDRQPAYSAFCKTMFDKRLVLHMELDIYHNPDYYWIYSNHSRWHFMISSTGSHLIAACTWCATYEFSSDELDPTAFLYKQVTSDNFSDLPESVQYLIERGFRAYLKANPCPELDSVDTYGEDDDEDEPSGLASYVQAHKDDLQALIQKASSIKPRKEPNRYIPDDYDSRFQGKRFFVKGIFEGYTETKLKEIAHAFGGAVIRKASGTDYFVYGSEIGAPFLTGRKNNVPFISADYFEDMTK
ncbi:MAG: BRCT domain-containing protein [Clostridiales bacterium]|nr:BRCT domain-containing protein [Clostridiales bacterium]